MRHGSQGGVGGMAGDVLAEEHVRHEGVPGVQRAVEEDEIATVAEPAQAVVGLALYGRLQLLLDGHASNHLLLLQVHHHNYTVGIQHEQHIIYGEASDERVLSV